MPKWLLPNKTGQITRTTAGRVYTGTAGYPTFFEDADVAAGIADGWTQSGSGSPPVLGALQGAGYPIVLAQLAIPVLLPPTTGTNTISAGGVITLTGITLPTLYTSMWVYLGAGDVVGGAAGLYYAVQTSNTTNATIQIYTNYASGTTAFTPNIPTTTLVTAVGSGAALVDNSGTDRTLANITVPGGLMGANGAVRATAVFSYTNSANIKGCKTKYGGSGVRTESPTASTSTTSVPAIRNRGIANSQIGGIWNIGATAPVYTTIDSSVDQFWNFSVNIAAAGKATDYIVLEGATVEVLPLN